MGELLKQVFMLTNVVSFLTFKSNPATQKSLPSNKHTVTFYIHALSDVRRGPCVSAPWDLLGHRCCFLKDEWMLSSQEKGEIVSSLKTEIRKKEQRRRLRSEFNRILKCKGQTEKRHLRKNEEGWKEQARKSQERGCHRRREFHETICLLLTNHTKCHAWNRAKKIFFKFSNYETTVDLGERKGSQKWTDVMS